MTECGKERKGPMGTLSFLTRVMNVVLFTGEDERWRNWFGKKDDFNFRCVEFRIPVRCAWGDMFIGAWINRLNRRAENGIRRDRT